VTIADTAGLIELGTAIDVRRRSAPPATGASGNLFDAWGCTW
jgi:hypothetical protein